MPLSDMYGRAFEFSVTRSILLELESLYPEIVKMTFRAREAQHHGQEQFENLTGEQKEQFDMSGRKIAEWLGNNKLKKIGGMKFRKSSSTLSAFLLRASALEKIDNVELDRIPDIAGVRGDVTDIRIMFFSKGKMATINVSLKHRHTALKHPRLTRVPEWIDLVDINERKRYLEAYESIWAIFFEKGNRLSSNAERFRELKAIDSNFIEENLYRPLYTLVASFLNRNIKTSSQVKSMFNFMVGEFDYVKFVDHDGEIEIRDFSGIPQPHSVQIEYEENGYLYLQFDNGWRISGRLHTATQWLKKSIKFDMQPCNLDSVSPAITI